MRAQPELPLPVPRRRLAATVLAAALAAGCTAEPHAADGGPSDATADGAFDAGGGPDADGSDAPADGDEDAAAVDAGPADAAVADGTAVDAATADAGPSDAAADARIACICDGPPEPGCPTPCYPGPAGTEGVGECRAGSGFCEDGFVSACDAVLPREEDCDECTDDDDCDGDSSDCTCCTGETVPCYTGPPGTAGVGACTIGWRACVDGVPTGPCIGEVTPRPEFCDPRADLDCDGIEECGPDCCDGLGCAGAMAICCCEPPCPPGDTGLRACRDDGTWSDCDCGG